MGFDPANDGVDTDGDGLCDAGDTDDDGDGIDDGVDEDPLDRNRCGDSDGDTCDDCIGGNFAPQADGPDVDGDGLCNAGDGDIDGDGRANGVDTDPLDPNVCADVDVDTCDDCTNGQFDPSDDGQDTDGDGVCDAGQMWTEHFPGNTLGAHWDRNAIGNIASWSVAGSIFEVQNSIDPPSDYIYNLDIDRGNQHQWPLPIGNGNFDLQFDLWFEANGNSVFIGYVGVVRDDGTIIAAAGYNDPASGACNGSWNSRIHRSGSDEWGSGSYGGPMPAAGGCTGSANFRIRRQNGTVTVYRDGAEMQTGTNNESVHAVALIMSNHRTYLFGTIRVDAINIGQ